MITFEQYIASDDYEAFTNTIEKMTDAELKAQVEETISWELKIPDCVHIGGTDKCLNDDCTGHYLEDVQFAAADWQDLLEG